MIRFLRRVDALDNFIEGIRPELKGIRTPEPTDALKTRIMASRAAGIRNILPVAQERRRSAPPGVFLAVSAALLIVLIPIELQRSASVGEEIGSPGVFGHAVFAQVPRQGDRPNLKPPRAIDGTKLRPLSVELERRVVDSSGRTAGISHMSLQVSAASLGSLAAWRVTSVARDPLPTPHVEAETVYVSRSDMRLLRRNVHVSPYRRFQRINVAQQFKGDSVIGRMTTEGPSIGAGRTFARELPRAFGPFMTETVAQVFLMAVPLSREWRGSASLLGWAVRDTDILLPIELRVEAEETITVPAGRFDCWRLSLRFSGKQINYWVRKSDGIGVRVVDTSDAKTKGTREIVLTKIQ
jgi:hypothetical protein